MQPDDVGGVPSTPATAFGAGRSGRGLRSRRSIFGGIAAGAAAIPLLGRQASAASVAEVNPRPLSVRWNAGAIDDGITDYTDKINLLYRNAAKHGATVVWDTTLGQGFVISGSGVYVPEGARTVGPGCELNRPKGTLTGAFLLPKDTSTTALLTYGTPGQASYLDNPHGSSVRGLGFRGTTPTDENVPGLWGMVVNDTYDITVVDCVALNFDPIGTGGAFFWNSTFSNSAFNGRVMRCHALRCGYGIKVEGPGTTDGKIDVFQANACKTSVSFGESGSGGNAWYLGPGVHLSGGSTNVAHLFAGTGTQTIKCTGVYFDVTSGWQINYLGRGLQCSNCFFLYGPGQVGPSGAANCPINLDNTGTTGPDTSIIGCRLNVNGGAAGGSYQSHAQGFVRLGTEAQPYSLIFAGNTVSAKGSAAPASWLGYVLNSAPSAAPSAVLSGSKNGTRDFASANQQAW